MEEPVTSWSSCGHPFVEILHGQELPIPKRGGDVMCATCGRSDRSTRTRRRCSASTTAATRTSTITRTSTTTTTAPPRAQEHHGANGHDGPPHEHHHAYDHDAGDAHEHRHASAHLRDQETYSEEHVPDRAPPHRHHHVHGHALLPPTRPRRESTIARTVQLEQDVLAKNHRLAERNRGWLAGRGILALNLMSSPGRGQDHAPRAHHPDLAASSDLASSRATRRRARRRAHPRRRRARRPDQHRHRLPPRRRRWWPAALARAGPAAAARVLFDRERRQPGLPGALRPRRARPGRDRSRSPRARTSRSSTRTCSAPPSSCS